MLGSCCKIDVKKNAPQGKNTKFSSQNFQEIQIYQYFHTFQYTKVKITPLENFSSKIHTVTPIMD